MLHYERLIRSFDDLGLPMGDTCHRIISQPRFVSCNSEKTQFFNHNAKPYDLLPAEKTYHIINRALRHADAAPDDAFQWCVEQINKSHLFSEGTRHDYMLRLARYCNIKGLSQDETLNGCLQFIQPDFPEEEIKDIIHHIYTKQANSHAKFPFKNGK